MDPDERPCSGRVCSPEGEKPPSPLWALADRSSIGRISAASVVAVVTASVEISRSVIVEESVASRSRDKSDGRSLPPSGEEPSTPST